MNRSPRTILSSLAILTLLAATPAAAQDNPQPDPWQPLRFLEGTWTGTGTGPSGTSNVTETYTFILSGHYMKTTTRAEFPPQEQNTKGEVHEDLAIFSYDHSRRTHILRGFYVEGFVNTFALDTISDTAIIFNTVATENAPPGTRARLMYRRHSDTEIEESFWVAFPGKDLSCFVTNRLRKTP